MDTTRSTSPLPRRARLLLRGTPLGAAAAAALALATGCTDSAQKPPAPGQQPAAHSVNVDHGPDGSSVTVDHGSDGSVSVDGSSVHVSGSAGSVSVQRNPDGSLTVTRPGAPPTTIPAGSDQAVSVAVDPSNPLSGSVSVNVGGGGTSVSVTH